MENPEIQKLLKHHYISLKSSVFSRPNIWSRCKTRDLAVNTWNDLLQRTVYTVQGLEYVIPVDVGSAPDVLGYVIPIDAGTAPDEIGYANPVVVGSAPDELSYVIPVDGGTATREEVQISQSSDYTELDRSSQVDSEATNADGYQKLLKRDSGYVIPAEPEPIYQHISWNFNRKPILFTKAIFFTV